MKKISLALALPALLAVAACGSHSSKRGGGLNTGPQSAAITLVSGNNNDVAIPGGSPGAVVRLISDPGGSTLTGISSTYFSDGDFFVVRNDATSGSITITNADTGSLAADRFLTPSAASVVLAPKMSTWVEFDSTAGSFVVGPGGPTQFSTGLNYAVETVSAAGALSTTKYTNLSVSGTKAYTLADGATPGQYKVIDCTVAASTPLGTVTITTPLSGESATHVFTAVGQRLTLVWQTGGWHVVGKVRAGRQVVVVGTTDLAGYDMCDAYDLSVTATVHSTSTKGIPAGSVAGEIIHLDVTFAATTPIGDIAITAALGVSTAASSWANITDTQSTIDAQWTGAKWQVIQFTAGGGVATLS